ncbi:DMT family transporter [Jannaschia sp.]|nr:DMT family transporter [Jannaschia sp.]
MSALGLGVVAALAWGVHDFLVRFITQKNAIATCIFVVLLVGLVLQTGLTLATGALEPLTATSAWLALAAGLSFAVAIFGLYAAFQRGPLWLAAPIVACFSALSVGLAAMTGAEITPGQWLAVLVMLCGIGMASLFADAGQTGFPPKGRTVLYSAITAVAFTATFEFGQALTAASNEMQSAMLTRAVALCFSAAVLLLYGIPFLPERKAVPILCLMALTDSIAILAVVSAGDLPDAQYTAVATSLYGLPAIWLASVFMKERMNLAQWGGCLIAFGGLGYIAFPS